MHVETEGVHDDWLKQLDGSSEFCLHPLLPGGLGGQTVVAPEENFDGEDCVVEEVSEVVVAKEVDVPPEVVVIVEVSAVGHEIQHRP